MQILKKMKEFSCSFNSVKRCGGCIFLCIFFLSMSSFKISSLNVNGARDVKKRAMVYELMRGKGSDIIFLQETHSNLENEVMWQQEWGGTVVCSHKNSKSGGVVILFSKGFLPLSYEVEEVVEGRLLKVRARYENINMCLINVYAPVVTVERVCFLETLSNTIEKCNKEDYLFIAGDFNCTVSDLDRNHQEPHIASRTFLKRLIVTNELCDIWRSQHEGTRQYTWAHVRENIISMARLDRFYVFEHQSQVCKSSVITPVGFSDHCLITEVVFINDVKPKSAYWHFNITLLSDAHFRKCFSIFWERWRAQKASFVSLQQWWDIGKIQIQQFCNQYTRNVTKDITRSMKALEIEIVELMTLVETTGDRGHTQALKRRKAALADLLGIRAQGALVRSKFQGISEMDASSKFFFGLEKKNGQRKIIHCLKSAVGQELTSPSEIRKRAVEFYAELYKCEYKEDKTVTQQFFDGLPKVPAEAQVELEQPLSLQDLYTALKGMENGRAPGIDGLPVDFFKSFWAMLGEDWLEVANDSLTGGLLPISCRRAVLTLLPKKGDPREVKNWRPVALLCTDYKILSKALSNRLREVMGQIIHTDQSYCVPGRQIGDNISLIRDFLDVSRAIGLDAGLISIDQEKAFDRVEHQYLWHTFEAFGFSSGFIAMIKVIYGDIESVLKVNGGLSAPFKVCRGIRQGCSMSGMLYAIAIEPLLNSIRSRIAGVCLSEDIPPIRLSAYADDVVVLVKNQAEVDSLSLMVDRFRGISSAKVNWEKSCALQIGEWSGGIMALPGGLEWCKGGFKYLGVYLGDEGTMEKNWSGVVEMVEGRMRRWRWLLSRMSYRGRTIIVNNVIASALWHRLSVLEPPSGLLAKIQAIIVDFFWDKYHWVPQSVLYLSKEEGGQGLVHLASRAAAFRFQFIQRLLYGPENVVWRGVAGLILQRVGGLGLKKALFLVDSSQISREGVPPFYRGLLRVWSIMKVSRRTSAESVHWLLEEPLVYGARLDCTTAALPHFSKILVKGKIITLRQLMAMAGPALMDGRRVAEHLGMRSERIVGQMLGSCRKALSAEEWDMLSSHKKKVQDDDVSFPKLGITPNIPESERKALLLDLRGLEEVGLDEVNGKELYRGCVKVLNKDKLKNRKDTPWRVKLGIDDKVKPAWRALYKPPLQKGTGDMQWRVLHGIIAVNAFVSVINSDVRDGCPFCNIRETIFHCFMECERIKPLLEMLESLFKAVGEFFNNTVFILGFQYSKQQKRKCQMLNFILGQAKMSIFLSRKHKIETGYGQDVRCVFKGLVKARIKVDFEFFSAVKDLLLFEEKWAYEGALCFVEEGKLFFAAEIS